MYIQFDKNNVHVQVICGSLETYTLSEKMKEIQTKTAELREKMEKFMAEVVSPGMKEIQEMVDAENSVATAPASED